MLLLLHMYLDNSVAALQLDKFRATPMDKNLPSRLGVFPHGHTNDGQTCTDTSVRTFLQSSLPVPITLTPLRSSSLSTNTWINCGTAGSSEREDDEDDDEEEDEEEAVDTKVDDSKGACSIARSKSGGWARDTRVSPSSNEPTKAPTLTIHTKPYTHAPTEKQRSHLFVAVGCHGCVLNEVVPRRQWEQEGLRKVWLYKRLHRFAHVRVRSKLQEELHCGVELVLVANK